MKTAILISFLFVASLASTIPRAEVKHNIYIIYLSPSQVSNKIFFSRIQRKESDAQPRMKLKFVDPDVFAILMASVIAPLLTSNR